MTTIQIAGAAGLTPQSLGALFRSAVSDSRALDRVVTLGPGIFDFGPFPAMVAGHRLIVRGAGRDATVLVGHGETHSSFACAIECTARDVTFEDLTLQSDVGAGAQSCVVGYASSRTVEGASLTIRRCRVLGSMFGVYSWIAPRHRILLEDSEIAAGRFVCAPAMSGAGADSTYLTIRRCVIRGDASLRQIADDAPPPNVTGDDETYSTVYGIYFRGGTVKVYDSLFDLKRDSHMHAVLGVGFPSNAAAGSKLSLVNCVFEIEPNGALRAADIETQLPSVVPDIQIYGGVGHQGGLPQIVVEAAEHIEQ